MVFCGKCRKELKGENAYCTNCGTGILDNGKCKRCGSILKEGVAFCIKCGHDINAKIYCIKCGNANPSTYTYCVACGSTLQGLASGIKKSSTSCLPLIISRSVNYLRGMSRKNKRVLIVTAVFIFILVFTLIKIEQPDNTSKLDTNITGNEPARIESADKRELLRTGEIPSGNNKSGSTTDPGNDSGNTTSQKLLDARQKQIMEDYNRKMEEIRKDMERIEQKRRDSFVKGFEY